MRKIIKILLFFMLLSGCAINRYPEEKLILTKVYCGKVVNTKYDEKITTIQTTMLVFMVKGDPGVPEGAYCYIRRIPCYQDVTRSMKRKLEPKYFSWNNSKEYRVKGNIPYKLFNYGNK